jgi:hypothetical protein
MAKTTRAGRYTTSDATQAGGDNRTPSSRLWGPLHRSVVASDNRAECAERNWAPSPSHLGKIALDLRFDTAARIARELSACAAWAVAVLDNVGGRMDESTRRKTARHPAGLSHSLPRSRRLRDTVRPWLNRIGPVAYMMPRQHPALHVKTNEENVA